MLPRCRAASRCYHRPVAERDAPSPTTSSPLPAAVRRVIEAAERKGVTLEITVFGESTHTAEQAAAAVGAELGQIVKSLVFVVPGSDGGEHLPVLCLVSGANRVDLARLAAVTGEPAIRRATAREANDLTGYVIGGIPPLGHASSLRTIMDPDLGRFPVVWAAAGTQNAVFPVPPATLRSLANATVAPIAEEPTTSPTTAPPAGSAPDPGAA